MKRRTQRLLLTLAAVGVLGTTAAAWAATGDRGACHGPADGPRAERLHQRHAERGAQRMAEHQAQLKAALKLTPAQEGAWKQFTQALQTSPTPHQGLERDDWTRLTTPQRLEKMQAFQAARQARMGQRIEALQRFYATLSPEQQKVFDAQHLRLDGMGGPGRHGGPHGHRHG